MVTLIDINIHILKVLMNDTNFINAINDQQNKYNVMKMNKSEVREIFPFIECPYTVEETGVKYISEHSVVIEQIKTDFYMFNNDFYDKNMIKGINKSMCEKLMFLDADNITFHKFKNFKEFLQSTMFSSNDIFKSF